MDPFVLRFPGLEDESCESDLEAALMQHLTHFFLGVVDHVKTHFFEPARATSAVASSRDLGLECRSGHRFLA